MTKVGNTHLRRLLVEAAWHHGPAYRIGKPYVIAGSRPDPLPGARGNEGQRWPCATAGTACAPSTRARQQEAHRSQHRDPRELAGWWWSLTVLEE